jgi:hypothetical protein
LLLSDGFGVAYTTFDRIEADDDALSELPVALDRLFWHARETIRTMVGTWRARRLPRVANPPGLCVLPAA